MPVSSDLTSHVVQLTDGYTIKILDANKKLYKVHLTSTDAPEKGQRFGMASKRYLS